MLPSHRIECGGLNRAFLCGVPLVLVDRFGRNHTSLRVSVTDRCNLRCTYCMPAETPDYCERDAILTFEEIARVVRIAVELGVDDVRLTGGEPLMRSQLHKLVSAINEIEGVRKLSLTTNGILLSEQLPALYAACSTSPTQPSARQIAPLARASMYFDGFT